MLSRENRKAVGSDLKLPDVSQDYEVKPPHLRPDSLTLKKVIVGPLLSALLWKIAYFQPCALPLYNNTVFISADYLSFDSKPSRKPFSSALRFKLESGKKLDGVATF